MMSNSNWWANKLGGTPSSTPTPATTPPPGNVYRATPGAPNTPVSYDPNQDQLVTKAQSARAADRCPACNSGNYMSAPSGGRMRCYDCGYPIVQQGSGLAGTGTGSGPVVASKQPNQGGGFNPTTIVGRLE
jgi:ribosomal protein S27AE